MQTSTSLGGGIGLGGMVLGDGTPKLPRIAIVALSHNTSGFTVGAMDSIRFNCRYPNYTFIIVDNGSDPSHSIALRAYAASYGYSFHRSDVNLGYGGGMNKGIRAALADESHFDYVLLLNDDTLVNQPDFLDRLLEPFLKFESVGVTSPMTNYASHKHQDIKHWPDQKPHNRFMETFDLIYVCVLFKREVLEKAGIFDEQFMIGGYEDNDLSLRVIQAGYRLIVTGKAFIFHYGSVSNTGLRSEGIDYWKNLEINKAKFIAKWNVENIDDINWRAKFMDMSKMGVFLEEERKE